MNEQHELETALCKMFGVDPATCQRIVVDIRGGYSPRVIFERAVMPGEIPDLMDVVAGLAAKAEPEPAP